MTTFRTVVELGGKTATGLPVPDEVVASLGRGKRVPVTVRLAGHAYRSTISPMGGRSFIPLSAENREAAGLAAGDEVEVTVEVDDAPREIEVPDDLRAALEPDATAATFFAGLSFSRQRAYVDWINTAKQAPTRERRVAQAVEMLREGRTR